MFKKQFNYKAKGFLFLLSLSIFLSGCVPPEQANTTNTQANTNSNVSQNVNSNNANAETAEDVSIYGDDEVISEQQVEQGRLDQDWKKFVQLDPPTEKGGAQNKEKSGDITPENVNTGKQHTPLSGDASGPSVLRVQILLDRSNFSPGIMDAKWGKNTEKAVYWLQKSQGMPANGQVDQQTYQKLLELAGNPDRFISEHKLTEKDVSGPFVKIPADIYEKEKLECMCFETLEEKLSEMFHSSPALLKQLNPKAALNDLKAGDTIMVPNVTAKEGSQNKDVARIVVSDGGKYVHGLDSQGKLVVHYPSTLGSKYNPSPEGDYKVTAIARDPTWHYQPQLLGKGEGKTAMIPPGPNNAVGVIWMALSKPHFGIHGTNAPETIGYTTSSGCIRLTNWDATDLGGRIEKGTPVEFRDTVNRSENSGNSGNTNSK